MTAAEQSISALCAELRGRMGPDIGHPTLTMQFYCYQVARLLDAAERCEKAERECARLTAWLQAIEGGEHPCMDEGRLRGAAYSAITLGHDAPKGGCI